MGTIVIKLAMSLTILTLLLLLIGCASLESPESPESMGNIVIATSLGMETSLVSVAAAQGYFSKQGLNVTLQPHTSGKSALASLLEGKADLATTADFPFIISISNNEPLLIVASIDSSDENYHIVARKDRGILRSIDLKNKIVGLTKNTNSELFLDSVLLFEEIPNSEVQIIDLKPENMTSALLAGTVDAVVTWNPFASQAQKALGDNGIDIVEKGIYFFIFNLVAKKEYLAQNPVRIEKILRALLQAQSFIQENPEKAQMIIAEYSHTDKESLKATFENYKVRLSLDQFLLPMLETETLWMMKHGLVNFTTVPNYLDYIYFDALEKVKPEAITVMR